MEIKFTDAEIQMLKLILSKMAIQENTGAIGVIHGLDRFISLDISLKKKEKEQIDNIAHKLKLGDTIKRVKK